MVRWNWQVVAVEHGAATHAVVMQGGTRVRAPWADPLPLSGSGLMPPWVGGAPGSTPRGPTLYHQVAAA